MYILIILNTSGEDCSPAAVMDQPAVVWNMTTITV